MIYNGAFYLAIQMLLSLSPTIRVLASSSNKIVVISDSYSKEDMTYLTSN